MNNGRSEIFKPVARPEMFPKVVSIYSYYSSKYPDQIRVPFADGHVVTYDIHIEQPRPNVGKHEEKMTIGYRYKG